MNHFKVSIGYSKSKPIIIVYYNQMRHRYWNGKAINVNLKSVENATLLKAAFELKLLKGWKPKPKEIKVKPKPLTVIQALERGVQTKTAQSCSERFIKDFGLSEYDADNLSADRKTAEYFEVAAKNSGQAKLAANWIMGDIAAKLNQNDLGISACPIAANDLAGLIKRIDDGTISSKIAKQIFEAMWKGEGDADKIIADKGLKQVSDTGALEKLVDDVINNNAKQVENYRNADEEKRPKMLGFFVGQIMKASKGQANPQALNEILIKKLN